MSKKSEQAPSVQLLKKYLDEKNLLNIYFFFGEDFFCISEAVKQVEKAVEPLLSSDFDKEVISLDKKQSLAHTLDIASAFPFGSGKKLIILKNFENIDFRIKANKAALEEYIKNVPKFTILAIANFGKFNWNKEPFNLMRTKNYIFECRKLKGRDLINWLMEAAAQKHLRLATENAQTIIDMVGDDQGMLEMHIGKYSGFLKDDDEITLDIIRNLSSHTKEFSIFDFLDAIGIADKAQALKIGNNLLDSGKDILFIMSMLTKYFITITQSLELSRMKLPDNEACKEAGVSHYYYINCKKAVYFRNDKKLLNVMRNLLNAELMVKSSSAEAKTVLTMLISQLFN